MSLSPKLDPTSSVLAPYSPPINPHLSPGSTVPDARLSSLLTEAYNNVDILRRENLSLRERAEKADRIFKSLQALPSPSNSNPPSSGSPTLQHPEVARLLLEYEDRARRAEQARDEADARRRMLADNWVQLDRYLANIELRAADARTGYARAVAEASNPIITGPGGVGIPTSNSMPPPSSRHRGTPVFPALTLPPLPNANSVSSKVRPRAGSLDGSYVNQPPSKKPRSERDERRGREERAIFTESQSPHLHSAHTPHQYAESREREYQPATSSARLSRHHLTPNHGQARMIMPGNDRPRSPSSRSPRSRSSSRSSASSLSLDEMLLRATTGDERNGGAHATTNGNGNGNAAGQAGLSPPANAPPIHRHRHHRHRDRSPSRHSHPHGHTHSSHTHSHASIHPEDLASRQYQLIQQQQQRLQQQSQLSDTYAQPGTAYRPRAHTSTGIPSGPGADNAAAAAAGPLAQPGQVQTYQTHVFAPVVTGAPVKKSKFPVGGSGSTVAVGAPTTVGSGPVDTPPAAPPASSFPATNASGQRICRQCGMAGRYKDGKCVEKWGPGPMGPGTVCDRCRKKMKRVERRGTLENQQLASTNSITSITAQQQQLIQQQQRVTASRPVHRTDTILNHPTHTGPGTHYSFGSESRERDRDHARDREESNLRTGASTPTGARTIRPPPSPPAIASLPDDPAASPRGPPSRSSSRNGRTSVRAARRSPAGLEVGGTMPVKRSPLGAAVNGRGRGGASPNMQMDVDADGDGEGEVDADADADADLETVEAEVEMADADVDGEGDNPAAAEGENDAETDADAEADLLEAVDAAAANSNGSGSSGGSSRLKAED